MKRRHFAIILTQGVILLALAACTLPFQLPFSKRTPDDGRAAEWQTTVDAIRIMTREQDLPNHLMNPEAPVSDNVFDPNTLLNPLDHLTLEEGYVLDFVYVDDGLGAYPVLYARPESQAPYEDIAALEAAVPSCEQIPSAIACNYLTHIIPDGSEESYFQWVLLQMMGDQFYLFWHAYYHDAEIILTETRLNALFQEIEESEFGYPLSKEQRRDALNLNLMPEVTIRNSEVTIRVVWFTKWGGFKESIYTISKNFPCEILDIETTTLVPYDCMVNF